MTFPIRCEGLSKKFRRVAVLDGLDLEVPTGSIYALVGSNGAGKTTLIKLLMNILQPTRGAAFIQGANSRLLSSRDLTGIGYVSENQELPEWMTIAYFLSYLKPFYPNWDHTLADELIRQFDLPLDRKLHHLSRGMKMKAALASSLAYHPSLIILDEPFSGLDPLVRDEFNEGLLERAGGATVFISSHDLAEIESFASHIGYLDKGRIAFSEEMTSLSERFREVEITLERPASPPSAWPETWLGPQTSGSLVRFVETRFDRARSDAQIAEIFPQIKNVDFRPMPLRDIFVALARSTRKQALKETA